MSFIKKYHLPLFFLTWFILNLVQAANTELIDDEAYYWIYSKFLDWGYFDHPPMIAVLIRAGYNIFHNELGVRLLTVILSTATLVIIYHLLPRKNDGLFYAIACSAAVLQIGGIIAVPDIPLAFFVALFFLAYKRFLHNMSLFNTVLLGVIMALLLYSKYHGILIIIFTMLSNLKLATRWRPYLACLIGALLFLPHLYWQYVRDFPSVQYHLFERNAPAYDILFSIEYIGAQLLLPGPISGILLIWAGFRYKPTDVFERALKFSMIGFYAFFLFSTFKGKVEANWTVPVLVPLIILSHQYLLERITWQRWLVRSVPYTLALVLVARIYVLVDFSTPGLPGGEFHRNRSWADSIYRHTGGLPAVFINTYQKASKYWFYQGVPSFSMNTPSYRRNNFNIWPIEEALYGKKVAVISKYHPKYYEGRIMTPMGKTNLLVIDSFFSFSTVKILAEKYMPARGGKVNNFALTVATDERQRGLFQSPAFADSRLELWVFKEKRKYRFITPVRLSLIKAADQEIKANFVLPLPPGDYLARFALPSALAPDPSLNSRTMILEIR